jgi:hypothetical protein
MTKGYLERIYTRRVNNSMRSGTVFLFNTSQPSEKPKFSKKVVWKLIRGNLLKFRYKPKREVVGEIERGIIEEIDYIPWKDCERLSESFVILFEEFGGNNMKKDFYEFYANKYSEENFKRTDYGTT